MSSNRKYIVLGVGLVTSCIIFGLFCIKKYIAAPSEEPSTALFKAPFLDSKNSSVFESFGSWNLDVSTAYDEFIKANEKNKKLSKEDFAIILNSLYFAVKDRVFFLREKIVELSKLLSNFTISGYVESAKEIERDLKKFINIQNQFYDFFKDLFEENNNFQKFLDPQYHLFEFNIEDGKIILDKEEISIIKTFGEYLKNLENYKFLISEQNRDKIFEKTFSTNLGNISGAELMAVKLYVFLIHKYSK